MNKGIGYKSVKVPEDFLLFSLKNRFKSEFFEENRNKDCLKLKERVDNFYPEIYLELTLKINTLSSLMRKEITLVETESKDYDGYKLYIDQYGYLKFNGRGRSSSLIVTSSLSLTSFVNKVFKIAIALNNSAFVSRKTKYWKESTPYNQLLLLVSGNENSQMEILSETRRFPYPLLSPIPGKIKIPLIKKKSEIRIMKVFAHNTARYELFQEKHKKPSKCIIESNFPGASKFFPVYHDDKNLIDIYTGPEFCTSTSYWIFAKVKGATKNKTRLRIHLSIGHGAPNMAPVFFWSRDRKNWLRMNTLEVTNDRRSIFYPLLLAPAKDFYLSSSIPFMEKELKGVIENVKNISFVEVVNVGKTVEGRDIKLFKITDPNVKDSDKKNVAIIVGQHSPMEMLGGHFLIPIIDYFKKYPKHLKKIVLYFVPIVNIDCAYWGGNGLNVNKMNTNRCWFKNLQPETIGIRNYFKHLKKEGINLYFFLDIHAGGTWKNHTLLRYPDVYLKKTFPKIFNKLIHKKYTALKSLEKYAGLRIRDGVDFAFRNCCAEDYFRINYQEAMTFTLELSTSSYFDPIKRETRVIDQNSLKIVGEGLIKSILYYFGFVKER